MMLNANVGMGNIILSSGQLVSYRTLSSTCTRFGKQRRETTTDIPFSHELANSHLQYTKTAMYSAPKHREPFLMSKIATMISRYHLSATIHLP